MAIAKAERLMNLALCLMGTRRPLSKRELRESIEAYLEAGQRTTPSTGCSSATRTICANSAWSSRRWRTSTARSAISPAATATACRPSPSTPRRPPPSASPPRSGSRPGWPARPAARCRSCAPPGCPRTSTPYEAHGALEPRIPVHEAAFEPLMLACRDRRPVVFDYRKATAAPPSTRQVEPWALECWRGHWYLAGWDRDRGAERVFRLSRITGRVRSRAGRLHRRGARRRHRPGDRRELGGRDRRPLRADPAAHRLPATRCGPRPSRYGNSATAGTSWRFRTGTGWTPGSSSSGPTWWSWSPPSCGPMSWTGCAPWPRAEGDVENVAGKPARPTNAIDQTRRMLSLVTYLRERPGARRRRCRPRLRDHRGRADLRPRRAAACAAPASAAATSSTSTPTATASGGTTPPP